MIKEGTHSIGDLQKMFSTPALTEEEIMEQEVIALAGEELAKLSMNMPRRVRASEALLRGLSRWLLAARVRNRDDRS
jgi:hypothetical protein